MHGQEVEARIPALIAELSEGMGCAVEMRGAESLDGGWLLRLRGDGNPWESDEATSHVIGHHDDRDHTVHLSHGEHHGWHFWCLSEESRMSGVADAEPDCIILTWISRSMGTEGPDRIRDEHAKVLMDAAQAKLWEAVRMLESVPTGTTIGRGMMRDAATIMRRVAGS